MKRPADALHRTAADEAALWAARLDGDSLDGARRTELDAWLARDPQHRALLSQYCQFSADLERQLPELVAAGAVTPPAASAPERRFRRLGRLGGLGLAAAAAVALVVWFARPAAEEQLLATSAAQRSTYTLTDGTRVELNARTTLHFASTGTARRVRLERGEALFVVAKDPARPFVVETPAGTVRVTGTTFSVRNDPATAATLEVLVVEGSVKVRPAAATAPTDGDLALAAGDRLTAGPRGVEVRPLGKAALENALAWRDGYAVFEDVPLSEAAACFARYHDRPIVVAPDIAAQRLGGFYRIDDLRAFVAGLESTALPFPVQVNEGPNGTLTLTRRSTR